MSKKYSEEEKLAFLNEAVEKYRKATELSEEAGKLMARCGVEMCSRLTLHDAYEEDAKHGLQVYKGIKNLARLLKTNAVHPLDIFKEPNRKELGVKHDGILFFQVGEPEVKETNFKYR